MRVVRHKKLKFTTKCNNILFEMSTYNQIVGLPNTSNTCYVNSLLQCLMSLDSFRIFCNNFNPLVNVSKLFMTANQSDNCVDLVKYQSFLNLLQSVLPKHFILNEQNDTHELFVLLIDHFYETNALKRCIKRMFYMDLEREIECVNCGSESKSKSIESSSALCISTDGSLEESLDYHFQSVLIGDWKCDKCDLKHERNHLSYSLKNSPEVLTIVLKRQHRKRRDKPKISHLLDLTKYIDTDDRTEYRYILRSLINHRGIINYGHYHAYVVYDIPEEKKFYTIKADDETTSIVKLENDVNTNDTYMLFYERVNASEVE